MSLDAFACKMKLIGRISIFDWLYGIARSTCQRLCMQHKRLVLVYRISEISL